MSLCAEGFEELFNLKDLLLVAYCKIATACSFECSTAVSVLARRWRLDEQLLNYVFAAVDRRLARVAVRPEYRGSNKLTATQVVRVV